MSDLVLNSLSRGQVDQFVSHPAHMLIIIGPDGGGKTALAELILGGIMNVSTDQLIKDPYHRTLSPVNGTISIDSVRELQSFMNLKTTGNANLRRGIIIEHADKLTVEAQNALLKLMEEPPADSVIIMTVNGPSVLLPTIYSRSQMISLKKPLKKDVVEYYIATGFVSQAVEQAYMLTDGLPGLMQAILSNNDGHPLKDAVDRAKQILQTGRFERLAMVNDLSKDKVKLADLIFALQRISQASLVRSIEMSGRSLNSKRWYNMLKESLAASDELSRNANTKLLLTNLFLNI